MSDVPAVRLLDHVRSLEVSRVERTRRHQLLDIVAIAICAVLCRADIWVEIAAFGHAKRDWFASFLVVPNGSPSHDTFGRVFAVLDPARVGAGIRSWVGTVAELTSGEVIAVAGQQLRRPDHGVAGKDALPLVSASATTTRLGLKPVAEEPEANEIPAIPALLRTVALEGCVVTVAAIGCQTVIATRITAGGAGSVVTRKDNQPPLQSAVALCFAEGQARGFVAGHHDSRRTVEQGHGRLEERQVWTVDGRPCWPLTISRGPGRSCAASPWWLGNAASVRRHPARRAPT